MTRPPDDLRRLISHILPTKPLVDGGGGRFYVRTRVQVIDPQTGEVRWKQVEKAAGSSKRQAQRILRELQVDADDGRYVPTALTVLELGRKWLREHVQPNLKPGAAANYKGHLLQARRPDARRGASR